MRKNFTYIICCFAALTLPATAAFAQEAEKSEKPIRHAALFTGTYPEA